MGRETTQGTDFQPGDKLIDCLSCGVTFLFTAGEQDYYTNKSLKPPKRCAPCRQIRREERQAREQRDEE